MQIRNVLLRETQNFRFSRLRSQCQDFLYHRQTKAEIFNLADSYKNASLLEDFNTRVSFIITNEADILRRKSFDYKFAKTLPLYNDNSFHWKKKEENPVNET